MAASQQDLIKPIDKELLLRTLAFWGDRTPPTADEPEIAGLAAQFDGDAERLLRVYQQYRKEFAQRRLALREAITRTDAGAISDIRHALRPHWQLLGLTDGVRDLDALSVSCTQAQWTAIEDVFRACDRALMRAQRALITTG